MIDFCKMSRFRNRNSSLWKEYFTSGCNLFSFIKYDVVMFFSGSMSPYDTFIGLTMPMMLFCSNIGIELFDTSSALQQSSKFPCCKVMKYPSYCSKRNARLFSSKIVYFIVWFSIEILSFKYFSVHALQNTIYEMFWNCYRVRIKIRFSKCV